MTLSFRTRLFVTAGLIVGLALSAVLLVGWIRVNAFEVDRLDERLCMEARRVATQPFESDDLPRLQADLLAKLRLGQAAQLMVKFESGAARPTASGHLASGHSASGQSANWRDAVLLDEAQWLAARVNPPAGPLGEGSCALTSFETPDQQWRAARYTANTGRGVIAADLAATKAELQSAFKQALKIMVPLALVLTALGAWCLSSLTMRPVNRMRAAMGGMTPKALNMRLPTQGEDHEFVVLIEAYNTMLARLEKSFLQASRFSSDAAHELKTPLTILQGRIEQALNRANPLAAQADLTGLQDEVGRLSDITRKLLLLSQADAGALSLQRSAIDLTRLLDELASDAQMLLSSQTLQCSIERRLFVQGDKVLLQQLMNNLISNAVKYCSPGGKIQLTARSQSGRIEVVLANASREIGAEERAQFFDRFYRGDLSRNRSIKGSGLGLSLSREIALAHGGHLELKTSAADVVKLRLIL